MNFSKRIARESKREETILREKIDEFKTLDESNPSNEIVSHSRFGL